jgi:hypothetical protein
VKTAQYSVHIGFCVYKMAIIFYGLHSMCIVVKIAKLNMEHCMWQAILLHDSTQKNDNLLEWSLDILGWSLDEWNKI